MIARQEAVCAMRRQSQPSAIPFILLIGVIAVMTWMKFHPADAPAPNTDQTADSYPHLALGNPSGATADEANADNFLMGKPYFALSYNNSKGGPNWVSWRLQASDLGPAPRVEFYPDAELPNRFKHVTPHDYTGSGFDRGHMCPRGDRTNTNEA